MTTEPTYEAALEEARTVASGDVSNAAQLALLCANDVQELLGPIDARLVWEVAMDLEMTCMELVMLCTAGPDAMRAKATGKQTQPEAQPRTPKAPTAQVVGTCYTVRLTLTNAPALTTGIRQTRVPYGLRIDYHANRTEIVVDYAHTSQIWFPSDELPQWLQTIVDTHRPADLSALVQDPS